MNTSKTIAAATPSALNADTQKAIATSIGNNRVATKKHVVDMADIAKAAGKIGESRWKAVYAPVIKDALIQSYGAKHYWVANAMPYYRVLFIVGSHGKLHSRGVYKGADTLRGVYEAHKGSIDAILGKPASDKATPAKGRPKGKGAGKAAAHSTSNAPSVSTDAKPDTPANGNAHQVSVMDAMLEAAMLLTSKNEGRAKLLLTVCAKTDGRDALAKFCQDWLALQSK